ncbi:DUF1660 domain-containing protein [Candidatus Woesearchaeota archaeon]|nr:DUF1660 domain-containing protein [Candidatus Woesearchaeota archaeon]
MKLIDKIFGHKWTYYKRNGNKYLRHCKRCNTLQEYRNDIPIFDPNFYTLVSYTKKGGEKVLEQLESFNKVKEK